MGQVCTDSLIAATQIAGFPQYAFFVKKKAPSCVRDTFCVAGVAPPMGMNFFLYEKMGRRAIIHVGSPSEAGTEILPPITLKRRESKGTRPLGERRAGSRPTALTLEQSSRGLSLPEHAETPGRRLKSPQKGMSMDDCGY